MDLPKSLLSFCRTTVIAWFEFAWRDYLSMSSNRSTAIRAIILILTRNPSVALPLPASPHNPLDGSFDAVISLSSVEYFGLGRYGDEFDLEGDAKAVTEMKGRLKPKGVLILTTTITRGKSVLAFKGHRIYSLEMPRAMCSPFSALQAAFFRHRLGRLCGYSNISSERGACEGLLRVLPRRVTPISYQHGGLVSRLGDVMLGSLAKKSTTLHSCIANAAVPRNCLPDEMFA